QHPCQSTVMRRPNHGCASAVKTKTSPEPPETLAPQFDYWAPKSRISAAFTLTKAPKSGSWVIQVAKSAYQYPLLVKQLWHTPLVQAPDQVIVYRDMKRFTYRQLRERIGRLASGLASLGVGAGDTVGVLDWDSNRFLEAYFAVPMMGAVLQTVNVRLS